MSTRRSPRSVATLVDEQVRKWAQSGQPTTVQAPPTRELAIITISREFGSLGAKVGQRVAERLGFSFWDQEIVHAVAQETGASEALLASLDEQGQTAINALIAQSFLGHMGATWAYMRKVHSVVHTLENQGSAVVVGRGSQFIVDPRHAVRVRVVCPTEVRVSGYAERNGIAAAESEKIARRVEKERRTFMRQNFDRDVSDPVHYDVCVNTGAFSLDQAADVVLATCRAKFGDKSVP